MQAKARRSGLVLACAAVALVVATGCAYPSAGRPACAGAILEDWMNDALQSSYPADCYEAAIDALPEDLRAYTTAAEDISRVAVEASREAHTRQLASASSADPSVRAFPTEVVLLTALMALLAATGLAAALLRRRRPR